MNLLWIFILAYCAFAVNTLIKPNVGGPILKGFEAVLRNSRKKATLSRLAIIKDLHKGVLLRQNLTFSSHT